MVLLSFSIKDNVEKFKKTHSFLFKIFHLHLFQFLEFYFVYLKITFALRFHFWILKIHYKIKVKFFNFDSHICRADSFMTQTSKFHLNSCNVFCLVVFATYYCCYYHFQPLLSLPLQFSVLFHAFSEVFSHSIWLFSNFWGFPSTHI